MLLSRQGSRRRNSRELRFIWLPLAAALLLWLAPAAHGRVVDDAAAGLRQSPLFVHPEVESELGADAARALAGRIERIPGSDLQVAVLPRQAIQESGGTPASAVAELHAAAGGQGIHVMAVPGEGLEVISSAVEGDAGVFRAANQASETHMGGAVGPLLSDFVSRVGAPEGAAQALGRPSGAIPPGGTVAGVGTGAIFLLVLGATAAAAVTLIRRERRRLRARALNEVRDSARDDLVVLSDDLHAFDPDVLELSDEAAGEHARACAAYQRAERAWKRACTPNALEPVSTALEEGRWAVACAAARLEGDEPPLRRPPCFFDAAHGPSSRDVAWNPPYGSPRPVPACELDAQRIERGRTPEVRQVLCAGRQVPFWDAGPSYGPYLAGFFGGRGATLLPALTRGSVLGSALAVLAAAPEAATSRAGHPGEEPAGGDFAAGDFGGGLGGGDP